MWVKRAAEEAGAARWNSVMDLGRDAYWKLDGALEHDLRVEPPPRTGAPMVYDPSLKALVMFGGHGAPVRVDLGKGGGPGAYGDTWIYDCETRLWREVAREASPPATLWPEMFHDPSSGKIVLISAAKEGRRGQHTKLSLWLLDAASGTWSFGGAQQVEALPRELYRWGPPHIEIGFDPVSSLVVLTVHGRRPQKQNYILRLDSNRLENTPLQKAKGLPPVRPARIPPANPEWVNKMKSLPANTWQPAQPKGSGGGRDWGSIEYDPLRAWITYGGGGHSSYQVRDVAVYVVGANTWVKQAGDHNDYVPPVHWGGGHCFAFSGALPACHNCNYHRALDGRRWYNPGVGHSMRKHPFYSGKGPQLAVYYDIDLGGVWRAMRIHKVTFENGAKDCVGSAHVVDPAGRIIGFGGTLRPAERYEKPHFSIFDIDTQTLIIRKLSEPYPARMGEGRPFCYVPGRDQVFYLRSGKPQTWVYDVKSNRFKNMNPQRSPSAGGVTLAEYVPGQDMVYVVMSIKGGYEEWVYSYERNDWAQLKTIGDKRQRMFSRPYSQLAYVPRYGVVVSVRGTQIMRPDFNTLNWQPDSAGVE